MAQQKLGWFNTHGRPGDRTIGEQLTGLDLLRERVPGKTVLDVGCAEGLIAVQLADDGAAAVHGLEIVKGHVEVASKLRGDRPVTFEVADVNNYAPVRQYDIVIMLAILQKLRHPTAACERYAQAAREMVVLRLPPRGVDPFVIVDKRSGNKPHNVVNSMHAQGFRLEHVVSGHLNEHISYWKRYE